MDRSNNFGAAAPKNRLFFEHIDRLGRVTLLPLSEATQHLFTGGARASFTASGMAAAEQLRQKTGSLTAREVQIFDLVIAGLSNKQIAYQLSISQRTVETHRARVKQKMGARNTASLVSAAMALPLMRHAQAA